MTSAPIETLRRAFVAGDVSGVPGPDCPAAAEIWDAAHGAIEMPRARALVRHVGTCAACAADWHLALHGEGRRSSAEEPRGPSITGSSWARIAGAAALLAGIGWLGVWTLRERAVAPTFRETPAEPGIRALLPENVPLSRSGARLSWSPVGKGARYTVEISLEDLTPLHTTQGLTATELEIPAPVLDRVGASGAIVWRVEARLPDGSRIRSGAFVHRIE